MNHFFALMLPPDAQSFVADIAADWRRILPPNISARWYAPEDCHITLKFLGNVSDTRHEELLRPVKPVTALTAPFSLTLAPCGGFPNLLRPFVLWAGIEQSPPLTDLMSRISVAMEELGFVAERRPYVPHITLARCRIGLRDAPLPAPDYGERAFPKFRADHIALMQTSPPGTRPNGLKTRYNTVHPFPLGDTHLSAAH